MLLFIQSNKPSLLSSLIFRIHKGALCLQYVSAFDKKTTKKRSHITHYTVGTTYSHLYGNATFVGFTSGLLYIKKLSVQI